MDDMDEGELRRPRTKHHDDATQANTREKKLREETFGLKGYIVVSPGEGKKGRSSSEEQANREKKTQN